MHDDQHKPVRARAGRVADILADACEGRSRGYGVESNLRLER